MIQNDTVDFPNLTEECCDPECSVCHLITLNCCTYTLKHTNKHIQNGKFLRNIAIWSDPACCRHLLPV